MPNTVWSFTPTQGSLTCIIWSWSSRPRVVWFSLPWWRKGERPPGLPWDFLEKLIHDFFSAYILLLNVISGLWTSLYLGVLQTSPPQHTSNSTYSHPWNFKAFSSCILHLREWQLCALVSPTRTLQRTFSTLSTCQYLIRQQVLLITLLESLSKYISHPYPSLPYMQLSSFTRTTATDF